ncbi:exported hypothetical protein [[Clostridium] ultunense Esp]|uniref:Lipoprotein n=1 Tax=[Clostridium] ultunense Esp TaxID=1288971 RepID=M1ZBR2_9FIRM|nr:hypothetical protein [Schnuerera ultunensis]CCQ95539.1 exported hypothetical protein [[Clostridium] ultunense Esp]SHD75608.1 conserved protein of unknown function [[Clostridium] ultunense Esp]
MRKILFNLIILALTLIIIGCSYNGENPLPAMEKNMEEKPLSYKIEKIALSKGFQSTESNVEVLKKTKNLKLLANIGLIESSGIKVDKITKSGSTINIYIDRLLEQGEIQLAVPQVLLEIQEPIDENIEDLKFNIVNQNFEPIPLKFNKDQILDKIYTHFKIEPSSIPDVKLTKLKEQIVWHISFTNIFDKGNARSPLINLNVKVDALTGEILDSVKDAISTYIDDGYLLDYIPNSYLLYKQDHVENNIEYETLWTYNITNGQRGKLYTSKDKIQSAAFSPNGECISIIEVDENKSDLYIISKKEKTAYKITPNTFLNPKYMKWKNDNILYFMDLKDGLSTFLAYDLRENKSNVVFEIDKNIESFDILDNSLVFTESQQDSINKNIYFYEDEAEVKKIGEGFKVNFSDNHNIIYLENVEEENKNMLRVYNIEKNTFENKLGQDIANYFRLDKDNIIVIEKNTHNSDYTINKFNIKEEALTSIAKINSDKVFYDSSKERGYVNLCPPHKEGNLNIIYSIDLKKLDIANIKN